jgi:beta-xylosidase
MSHAVPTIVPAPSTPPDAAWPWIADLDNGTFRNPVLCTDYSDPDVVRHGHDFYLTASSFNCTPGLPILHSRDLVNWHLINHAVKNLPHPRYADVQGGCGIWAPTIRFQADKFWIFFATPDEGIYVVTARDPAGRWSEPHLLQAGKGLIDPCPFWDDDGKAYLVHAYAHSRAGVRDILRLRPMTPDGSQLIGEGQIVFHSPERHPTIEGPKLYKKDQWYYLLAPAGGVATGWQVALRSRNIHGPYEDKIVLEQGSTTINGPHQGGLVDLPNGDWWFLHFQDAGVYGRIVHLQPVTWKDQWPLIGVDHDGNGVGEPVAQCHFPKVDGRHPIAMLQASDEFDSEELGHQWQWQANHHDHWCSLKERKGWLRLFSQRVPDADLAKAPNLLLQKFPARTFAAETLLALAPVESGDEAGLVVMGRTHAALAVRRNGSANEIILRENGVDRILRRSSSSGVRLRVNVEEGGLCQFRFATDEEELQLVPAHFQASAGDWIGAKVGIYCLSRNNTSGFADLDYFRFQRAT